MRKNLKSDDLQVLSQIEKYRNLSVCLQNKLNETLADLELERSKVARLQ